MSTFQRFLSLQKELEKLDKEWEEFSAKEFSMRFYQAHSVSWIQEVSSPEAVKAVNSHLRKKLIAVLIVGSFALILALIGVFGGYIELIYIGGFISLVFYYFAYLMYKEEQKAQHIYATYLRAREAYLGNRKVIEDELNTF